MIRAMLIIGGAAPHRGADPLHPLGRRPHPRTRGANPAQVAVGSRHPALPRSGPAHVAYLGPSQGTARSRCSSSRLRAATQHPGTLGVFPDDDEEYLRWLKAKAERERRSREAESTNKQDSERKDPDLKDPEEGTPDQGNRQN